VKGSDFTPVKVVVCDGDPLTRQGVRAILVDDPGTEITGLADDVSSAVAMAAEAGASIVVTATAPLGVQLVDRFQRLVPHAFPAVPGVLLLMGTGADRDELMSAIQAGIRGFVLKDDPADVIIHAVRAVSQGLAFFSPPLARDMLAAVRESRPAHPRLREDARTTFTRREHEVLVRLARGGSNKEIAQSMCVAEATVRSHIYKILQKTGLSSRSQAVAYAYRTELVRPDR